MKALQFHSIGDLRQVVQLDEVPEPGLRRGWAMVRMLASPINPSDRLFVAGKYGKTPNLPQAAGFEGCGVVEAAGGGLRAKMFKGKRVCVMNAAGGNWAQYACVPATSLIPVSKNISDSQAATFFVNPGSALAMCRWTLNPKPGQWLIQTAASSNLGTMVIKLGQHFGFRTLNIVRNESHIDRLKAAGADEVIVHDCDAEPEEKLINAVQALCADGVRYAIDPVGGELGSRIVRCLSHQGKMLAYGTLSQHNLSFSPRTLMVNAAQIQGFWLGNFMASLRLPSKLRFIRQLNGLVQKQILQTEISQTFPLEDFKDAFQSAESSREKTLFRIG